MFYLKVIFLMLVTLKYLKKAEITNKQMSRQAIKKGFEELVNKILLDKDKEKNIKIEFFLKYKN